MNKIEIDYNYMLEPEAIINLHIQQCEEINSVLAVFRERIAWDSMRKSIYSYYIDLVSEINDLARTMRKFVKYNLSHELVLGSDYREKCGKYHLVQMKIEMTIFHKVVVRASGYWPDLNI